ESQAAKVRRARVPAGRVLVIRDAVEIDRFRGPDPAYADQLHRFFTAPESRSRIVGAAGRLSPEKGFHVLVEAAKRVTQADPSIRFVLFGDGRLRENLQRQIEGSRLQEAFVLAGFRADLDRFLPHLDLFVLPSFTEGLPNVVLEAFAAGIPVVA